MGTSNYVRSSSWSQLLLDIDLQRRVPPADGEGVRDPLGRGFKKLAKASAKKGRAKEAEVLRGRGVR